MSTFTSVTLRHFILCEKDIWDSKGIFTAERVYEFFSSLEFPASFEFHCIVGFLFVSPCTNSRVIIEAYQEDKVIAKWVPDPFSVDKPYEIMNLRLMANPLIIPLLGPVRFDFRVNDEIIAQQFIDVRKEA